MQNLAYVVLVLLFAVPCWAMGIYFWRTFEKTGRRDGDPAQGFAYIFTAAGFGVLALGIIGCFV